MNYYKFNDRINRYNTNSSKWSKDRYMELYGVEEIIPLWLADMDYQSSDTICRAIENRAKHNFYGYVARNKGYYTVIKNWFERKHQVKLTEDDIVFTPGVMVGVCAALQAFTEKGDGVIIQPPIYAPIRNSVIANDLQLLENPLIYKDNKYTINFEQFEAFAKQENTKAFILCSPHNPSGRVFTQVELSKLVEICLKHNVFIISDEIHCDLVFDNNKHINLLNVNEEIRNHSLVLTSPSKAFNIAGLVTSQALIPNKQTKDRFLKAIQKNYLYEQNLLGIIALQEAYTTSDEWLAEMLEYLSGINNYIDDYLKNNIPNVKMIKPEGTNLAWLDFNYYYDDKLFDKLTKQGGLGFSNGLIFGEEGKGFMRMCTGIQQSLAEEVMERLKFILLSK